MQLRKTTEHKITNRSSNTVKTLGPNFEITTFTEQCNLELVCGGGGRFAVLIKKSVNGFLIRFRHERLQSVANSLMPVQICHCYVGGNQNLHYDGTGVALVKTARL